MTVRSFDLTRLDYWNRHALFQEPTMHRIQAMAKHATGAEASLFTQGWFEKLRVQLDGIKTDLGASKQLRIRVHLRTGQTREFEDMGFSAEHGIILKSHDELGRGLCIMPYSVIEYIEVIAQSQAEIPIEVPLVGFGAKKQKR
jgi:hypothetical protein